MNVKKIGGYLLLSCLLLVPGLTKAAEVVEVDTEEALRECVVVENNVCELTKDVALTQKLSISNTVTIDGGGNNIYGDSDNYAVYIEVTGGTFTITNAKLSQFAGSIGTESRNGVIKVLDTANEGVKLIASDLEVTDFNRSAFDISAGSFEISNVTIDCGNTNTDKETILTKGLLVGINNGKTVTGTIKDSKISNSYSSYEEWSTSAIEVYNGANVSVDNVKIDNVKIGVSVNNYYYDTYGDVKVELSNSDIDASLYAARIYSKADAQGNANINILSGNYANDLKIINGSDNDKITVSEGTFATDVKAFLAEKTIIEKVSETEYVVRPNKTIEAVDEDGKTIVGFESEEAFSTNYILNVVEKVLEKVEDVITLVEDVIFNSDKNVEVADTKVLATYDITVTDGENVVEMKDGNYTISVKVDEETSSKYNAFKAAYINDEGKAEEVLDATMEDGYVTFETTHLSTYSIIGYNATEIKNPQTSDNILIYGFMGMISLVSLLGTTIYLKKRIN